MLNIFICGSWEICLNARGCLIQKEIVCQILLQGHQTNCLKLGSNLLLETSVCERWGSGTRPVCSDLLVVLSKIFAFDETILVV